jgi:stage III sporulation protein AD
MNDIIFICGGVLGIVIINAVIRPVRAEWAMLVSVCLGLFILRRAVGLVYPIILYIGEITDGSGYNEYFLCAVKALGIATVTHITCETCRDLGENSAAAKVELCGKAAILLCAIPIIKEIFSYIKSFLQ